MVNRSNGIDSKLADTISIAVLLLVVYFAAGKLGLGLAFVNASVSPVWPSTGIALAALLFLGYRYWPVIWIGAFFVNISTAGSIATSASIATGNALEAILGAYLVNRLAGGRYAMSSAANVLKFSFLAVPPSMAASATIGALTLCLGHLAQWHEFKSVWLTWWLGDATGAFILVPPMLYFLRPPSLAKISLERKVTVALGFALVSLAAIGALQYRAARLFEGESQWVSRTQDVIRELDMALARLSDADASVQTFGLTGDTRQLFSFDKANQSIGEHLQTVRNLTVDNAAQQQAFTRLQVQMADALRALQEEIGGRKAGELPPSRAVELVSAARKTIGDVRTSTASMEATEFELLRQRKHLAALSNYQTNSLIFAGSVVAIILVAISGMALQLDIAERRRAERSLWSSRERFRLMIEGVEDYAIFLLDPEGRVITWNAGAERINGYEADEIIGRHFSCLFVEEDVHSGAPQRALESAAREGRCALKVGACARTAQSSGLTRSFLRFEMKRAISSASPK